MRTLTILPTTISARDWGLAAAGKGAVLGPAALNRTQMVRQAFESVHGDLVYLSETESLAVLARLVSEFYAERPGATYAGLRHRSGFWRSLHRFLNECRLAGFSRGELPGVLGSGGVDTGRAELLGSLYDSYLDRLDRMGAIDAVGAECRLADTIRADYGRIPLFFDIDAVEIRGIYDIKPSTFEWILELSRHIPTTVFLPLPKDHPRSILWLEWTYRKFEYLGEDAPDGLTIQSEDLQLNRALADLLPRCFVPRATLRQKGLPPFESPMPLRILEVTDPGKEIMEVARRVRLRLEEGAKPERIAVLFRQPETYPNALEAFDAFGIPVEISADLEAAWSESADVGEMLSIAALAANGCDREELIGWLGRTRCDLSASLSDPDLGRFLREGRFMKGRMKKVSARLQKEWARRGIDPARQAAMSASIDDLLSTLRRIDRSMPAGRYLAELETVLAETGLFGLDAGTARARPARGAPEALIREILARLRKVFEGWSEELSPGVLYDLLLAVCPAEPSRDRRGGVRLLAAQDIAAIEVDHLFIVGMTAGSFPQEPKQEVFLKDWERREVSAAYSKIHRDRWGPRLAGHRPFDTSREERLRENFLFFLCLAQPVHSLTLSYPTLDISGRPVPCSPYIDELYKQFASPDLLKEGPEGDAKLPVTDDEREAMAMRAIRRGDRTILVPDPDRIAALAWRADIETRRERFFLERDRAIRPSLAFEYTGRLTIPGPFWKKEKMAVRALEAYAGCPFRGFAGQSMGLSRVDLPVEALSAKDMGSFLHRFLELFWSDLKKRYDQNHSDIQDILTVAREISAAAIHQAAREMSDRGAEGALFEGQKRALIHFVESLLQQEEAHLAGGYWPEMIEAGIDLEVDEGGARDVMPLRFQGKIDRMDRHPDGRVRIIDYKMTDPGTLRSKKNQIGRTAIQLPVYAHALARKLGLSSSNEIVLTYMSIRTAVREWNAWEGTVSELAALCRPDQLLDPIRSGRFDVTPEDETLCRGCEFRRACRVQEVLGAVDAEREEE